VVTANRDRKTVEGFGYEWSKFDQSQVPRAELQEAFRQYFAVFPWSELPPDAVGFDLGCGSGRWAAFVAERVGTLFCLDPSEAALKVAVRKLESFSNCRFILTAGGELPLVPNSMDFGYSLGVLHHTPDPARGLGDAVQALKPGAPFLVYLYYALDNRPTWYRSIWKVSDVLRRIVSRFPNALRYPISQLLAALVYWPATRVALLLEGRNKNVDAIPLSQYRHRSFYGMRTDALDRFTRLERRFTREEVRTLMESAGLDNVIVSPDPPYWCAVGFRRRTQSE
jgi:SAM-dependent methyltransferase